MDDFKIRLSQAWHTVAFGRTKTLPKLQTLLKKLDDGTGSLPNRKVAWASEEEEDEARQEWIAERLKEKEQEDQPQKGGP